MNRSLLLLLLLAACRPQSASVGALDGALNGNSAAAGITRVPVADASVIAPQTQDIAGLWKKEDDSGRIDWFRFDANGTGFAGGVFPPSGGFVVAGNYSLSASVLTMRNTGPEVYELVQPAYLVDGGEKLAFRFLTPVSVDERVVWERVSSFRSDSQGSTTRERYSFTADGTFEIEKRSTSDGDPSVEVRTVSLGTFTTTDAEVFTLIDSESGDVTSLRLIDSRLVDEGSDVFVRGAATTKDCVSRDKFTCNATAECEYRYPGCVSEINGAFATPEGCYPVAGCNPSRCTGDNRCVTSTFNPCANQTCDACGAETIICVSCLGAWKDQFNQCRAPNDGAYPPECCAGL